MNRRIFCGTSILAIPLVRAFAGNRESADAIEVSDPVMSALADEFAFTTMDGAREGFGAEHFRRYAGQVRIFNACLEDRGTNRRINKKLDEDDYYLLNPENTVAMTMSFWKQRRIVFDESSLMKLVAVDAFSYRSVKRAIKKQGGVQKLHERIAIALERKAEEYASLGLRNRLTLRNGFLQFPARPVPAYRNGWMESQYVIPDPTILDVDEDEIDCFCKAMSVEGAALSILCATICQPCCVPAAVLLGLVTLLENMDACDPDRC
ncbi:MAG: hypothetical protein P8Z37_17875 [Acidobacteriota bacterium]